MCHAHTHTSFFLANPTHVRNFTSTWLLVLNNTGEVGKNMMLPGYSSHMKRVGSHELYTLMCCQWRHIEAMFRWTTKFDYSLASELKERKRAFFFCSFLTWTNEDGTKNGRGIADERREVINYEFNPRNEWRSYHLRTSGGSVLVLLLSLRLLQNFKCMQIADLSGQLCGESRVGEKAQNARREKRRSLHIHTHCTHAAVFFFLSLSILLKGDRHTYYTQVGGFRHMCWNENNPLWMGTHTPFRPSPPLLVPF